MTVEKGSTLPSKPLYHLSPKAVGGSASAPEKVDVTKLEHPLLTLVVPGAFTPACSEKHMPPYLTKEAIDSLKKSGIKQVVVISVDSPFITRAWSEGLTQDNPEVRKFVEDGYIKFLSDAGAEWLNEAGLDMEANDPFVKDGIRGSRSAILTDGKGKVVYVGVDSNPVNVDNSSFEAVLLELSN